MKYSRLNITPLQNSILLSAAFGGVRKVLNNEPVRFSGQSDIEKKTAISAAELKRQKRNAKRLIEFYK